jgi:hypothetical protein
VPKVPTTIKQGRESLWKGPLDDGITYSLLCRFLCCRERFRLYVVEGLKGDEGFSYRLEYGNLLHAAMEATAAKKPWQEALLKQAKELVNKYGAQESKAIEHWYQVAKAQYPSYLSHWSKHKDVTKRKPLYQEKVFNVTYELPSGRVVRLRGKFDSVDIIGKGVYLQENKTKGDIIPERVLAELPLDLQTMVYLTALDRLAEDGPGSSLPVAGARYNVIRRPLSGGKFSISQKKGLGKAKKGAETEEQFYKRLAGVIATNAEHFYYRWKIEVTPADLQQFQRRTFNPILEQLCDWWEYIRLRPFDPWNIMGSSKSQVHYLYPSGVWNPTLEGRSSPYDGLLLTGSDRGLTKVDNLFRELEE